MGNSCNGKKKIEKVPYISISTVKPPPPILSQSEYFETWFLWKNDVLLFIKLMKDKCPNKTGWENILLNLMGPVGQDIYDTFTFNSANEKENMNILLTKFDTYCIFASKKRQPSEDIYKYINNLESMTKERNCENAEKLIKYKISTEIDKCQFTKAAKSILPSFIFLSNFDHLTLKEIAFIWKLYDDDFLNNCENCGNVHSLDKCPALKKQCSMCHKWDHFIKRCPWIFINKCKFCAGAHIKKQCPAFNETCTKCQKLNHFSWACQYPRVLHCCFCGLSHSRNRSVCPAEKNICSICKSMGHFPSQCKKGFNFHKY